MPSSEKLHDHRHDDPAAVLLDRENLKLLRSIMPPAPNCIKSHVTAEAGAPELGRKPLAATNRGNDLVLSRPSLGHALTRMRFDDDTARHLPQLSILSAAMNASCGISTRPNWRMR